MTKDNEPFVKVIGRIQLARALRVQVLSRKKHAISVQRKCDKETPTEIEICINKKPRIVAKATLVSRCSNWLCVFFSHILFIEVMPFALCCNTLITTITIYRLLTPNNKYELDFYFISLRCSPYRRSKKR